MCLYAQNSPCNRNWNVLLWAHFFIPLTAAFLASLRLRLAVYVLNTLHRRVLHTLRRRRAGRAGAQGNKYRMTLGLPVAAVMNCCDNSGAKNLYIISVCGIKGRLNRLPSAGENVCVFIGGYWYSLLMVMCWIAVPCHNLSHSSYIQKTACLHNCQCQVHSLMPPTCHVSLILESWGCRQGLFLSQCLRVKPSQLLPRCVLRMIPQARTENSLCIIPSHKWRRR